MFHQIETRNSVKASNHPLALVSIIDIRITNFFCAKSAQSVSSAFHQIETRNSVKASNHPLAPGSNFGIRISNFFLR